jgi:hypothetical protein
MNGVRACPKPRKRKPARLQHNSTLPAPAHPIARSTRPARSARIKPKSRPKAETERAHGPAEYREWMKSQPCIVRGCREQPCDAAHIHSGGTGRKGDYTETVALCSTRPRDGYRGHHEQYDARKKSFPIEHELDMAAEAAANQRRWHAVAARVPFHLGDPPI